MSQKVVHIPEVGNIILKKNPRSRRIKLYVKPDKQVVVTLPQIVPFHQAESFALKNISWIRQQQSQLNSTSDEFKINSAIYTKTHVVKITEKNIEKEMAIIEGDNVNITIPPGTDMQAEYIRKFIRAVITEIYRSEAKSYLPRRVAELAQKHDFHYNKITIRDNKTNWGSCSASNNISLNLNLMKLPDHLIDYIILHELSHTLVKNHSVNFYGLLDYVTGGRSRELAKEIKIYSAYTY